MPQSRSKNLIKNNLFPIVCVGASAGGLEALSALFRVIPENINMAFVLIQHMEPHHKSALSEILSRETSLSIREAKNNTKVEPTHVYVIPSNTLMAITKGRLRITSRVKRLDGRYLPVDFFMTSLAKDQGSKAIGIVLSGTGSDGTQGAKEIKSQGGIVFAQDEKTARYFGMPESVILGGAADYVLEPKKIAIKLKDFMARGYDTPVKSAVKISGAPDHLNKILVLLRDLTGMDFTHYKLTTIKRRIARRMAVLDITTHGDYYNYLRKHPTEADVLDKDILIPVTSFFRESETFEILRKKIFPLIANKRSSQNPIRLWVPACSSGEEVYSLAIFLYEFLEARKIKPHIQVFGTDLNQVRIEKARNGVYPQDISSYVSAERLRRFFVQTDSGYKIAKHIRDLCVFAKHDLTGNPPLSNMDIVSCRNLLIYFDAFLQNKVLRMLHYALKPKGVLVLGTSESVTAVPDFFSALDKTHKIYSKNMTFQRAIPPTPSSKFLFETIKLRPQKTAETVLPKQGHVKRRDALSKKKKTDNADEFIVGNDPKDVVNLKKEFERAVKQLNAISEEKDTVNEELRAASEEIQSSNEELQSMNEELETSKEELQSTNEELLTLNEELQNKNTELSQLNSDLSNIFSSTNIPIIIVGNDLRIKRFTPMARKVMNLIPSDVDRPIGDIKLNIDIENLEQRILGVIEDMVPKESDVKDKEGRWYSMRLRPYRTIDNRIDGAVISLIDIDISKRSREEAEDLLNYSNAIIETMGKGLVVLNPDMRIDSVNKFFCDMFGVQAAEVKNKLLFDLGAKRWGNAAVRKLLEKVLPKKKFFNDFEATFDYPLIGKKTFSLSGRQIKWQGKISPLILLVIEDITKRKRVEQILARDKVALDKIINKRTAELLRMKSELVKSKHMSSVGTMAATVAHELRNPLADIALSLHRIKKINKNPVVAEILEGANSRVGQSNQIINDILMYSKTAVAHYELFKINDLLRSALDDQTRKRSRDNISIVEKIERTKDLSIEADPVRLKEVILNILQNAFDAVSADSGIIEVETDVGRDDVFILIKDNGEGIERRNLKNVASPFFTTKATGTGLGLAVCKQVVASHRGSLTIKSEKGKGATVAIKMPIHKPEDA